MGITPEGIKKRRDKLIERYGSYEAYLEQNRKNASLGGKKGGKVSKGNFKCDPKRASELGKKGGRISRRRAPVNAVQDRPDDVQQKAYKNERQQGKKGSER